MTQSSSWPRAERCSQRKSSAPRRGDRRTAARRRGDSPGPSSSTDHNHAGVEADSSGGGGIRTHGSVRSNGFQPPRSTARNPARRQCSAPSGNALPGPLARDQRGNVALGSGRHGGRDGWLLHGPDRLVAVALALPAHSEEELCAGQRGRLIDGDDPVRDALAPRSRLACAANEGPTDLTRVQAPFEVGRHLQRLTDRRRFSRVQPTRTSPHAACV